MLVKIATQILFWECVFLQVNFNRLDGSSHWQTSATGAMNAGDHIVSADHVLPNIRYDLRQRLSTEVVLDILWGNHFPSRHER